jgi:outer membrane biosynthesis protein TonB
MKLLSMIGTAALALTILIPVYGQQDQQESKDKPAKNEEKHAQQEQKKTQPEQRQPQQEKQRAQQEKPQQEKPAQRDEQHARDAKPAQQNEHQAQQSNHPQQQEHAQQQRTNEPPQRTQEQHRVQQSPCNNIAHTIGIPTTATGNNAAATTATAFPTTASVDTLVKTMDSGFQACPFSSSADIHDSNTAATGSAWSIPGRNTGAMTGTTMTTFMWSTLTTAITFTTAGIPTSALLSTFRCSQSIRRSREGGCAHFTDTLRTRSNTCLERS